MGLQRQIVAFALLFTDVQQADARLFHLKNITAVNVSEECELMQVGGFAIHVGANVQHQNRLRRILGWEEGADRRAVNAFEASQPEDGGGHHGTGVARGVHRQSLTALHQIHGHVDAGVAFPAHGCGLIVHTNRWTTGHQIKVGCSDRSLEPVADLESIRSGEHLVGFTDETHLERKPVDGLQAAFEDGPRGVIAAHAVHRHPEAFRVQDFGVLVSPLQTPQRIKHKGLEHAAGHAPGTGHHRARHRAGSAG